MPMNLPIRNSKFENIFICFRTSFWFVPALFMISAVALALGLLEVDQRVGDQLHNRWPRLFDIEAEAARSLLSSVATSVATVVGVVFSITIVALTLASTQYSSRVLRTFMRDVSTQCVLGALVGTFIYCLLVLRSISSGNGSFTPSLAIFVGFLLGIVSICFFIYFIHHISSTIQASQIIAEIARETSQSLERIFSDEQQEMHQKPARSLPPEQAFGKNWYSIPSHKTGYIQTVQIDAMRAHARGNNVLLRMECGIGEFIAEGDPLVSMLAVRAPHPNIVEELSDLYTIGSSRTIEQDPAFGIRQLVDIAMKALSPSINDTTTAVTCIQYISTLMAKCASKCKEANDLYDEQGQLRLIVQYPNFEQLMDLSFNQILENGKSNTEILIRLLIAIQKIAAATDAPHYRRVLTSHVKDLMEIANAHHLSPSALQRVNSHYAIVAGVLHMEGQSH